MKGLSKHKLVAFLRDKTRGSLGVGGTFDCESGATYKAVFVVTAYTGNVPETEIVEYIEIYPWTMSDKESQKTLFFGFF